MVGIWVRGLVPLDKGGKKKEGGKGPWNLEFLFRGKKKKGGAKLVDNPYSEKKGRGYLTEGERRG